MKAIAVVFLLSGAFSALADELTAEMSTGENWWGLCSNFGRQMPFNDKSDFQCDLRVSTYGNQSQSVLVSDRGRVLYCAEPVEATIGNGSIKFVSNRGKIVLTEKTGGSLASAFRFASKTYFPPAGGLDLQLLGIGFNGHVAFNEPMREDEISAAGFATLPTRVLPLSNEAIEQNTAITAGGDSSLVPRYAATMGMAPILAAKKCLLLACFEEQTVPLKAIMARGEPTPLLPASYLWRHPDFRLVYTTDKIRM